MITETRAEIASEQQRFGATMPIPQGFLDTLVDQLDSDDVVGIILGGSYARGEATLYSDVDIACFVKDAVNPPPKRFFYRDGYLVSIATKTLAGVRRDMARPNTAIRVVHGLAHYRVLLDKDGSVSRLLQDIESFTWEPLQKAADSYASYSMTALVELVHKVLNETLKANDLAVSYASSNLFFGLTEVVAIQRGILVKSDSTYYQQAQESVGQDSDWTRYHRLLAGVGEGAAKAAPVKARAVAVLRLYRETLKLLRTIMDPEHLRVAEQAMQVVDEASQRLSFPTLPAP